MSPASAAEAATIDWGVIASATGVFVGTLVATVAGVLKARKELKDKLEGNGGNHPMVGAAILQDNQSIREATVATKELRDQLFLHIHAMTELSRSMGEGSRIQEDILSELKRIREILDRR